MAIFQVFYAPGKLFESLKDRRGAWILPLIVNILLLIAITTITVRLMGMENIMRQRLENTRLSPEQTQLALSRANSPVQLYASYAGAALGGSVMLLAIAGLLTIFAMMSSRQPKFGTMFSMVTLAYLPYLVVSGLMTTLVLLVSPDRPSLDISNLLATNVGAFVDKASTSKALYSFFTSLDILSLAEVALLAYGFSKVTRTGMATGLGAVLTLWALYVIAKMGISVLL